MNSPGCVYSWCGCRDQYSGRRMGARCPLRGAEGHGSWYLSLELPPALDGSRRRIRRGGFPRRPHAEMALARLRMPSPGGSPLTVGQWLEHWLVSRTAPRILTLRGYAARIRLCLAPCLGQILLADLTPAHVQAMFTAISRRHEAMGRPVTTAALVRVKATLRTALNAAIRAGHLTANAAARAELPPARRPKATAWTAERVSQWQRTGVRPPVAVWTPAQTAAFLNRIRRHRLYAAYHLIALRGLRRGEACGLRWCDIDLDSGTAFISWQLQQYDGHIVLCPPKTARASGSSRWTAPPSPPCLTTGHASSPSAPRPARTTSTAVRCLPGPTATPWLLTGSRVTFASSTRPAARRSACTTSATAPPALLWLPEPT